MSDRPQTENDRETFVAFYFAQMEGRAPYGSWELAMRLIQRGVPPTLAVRIAMTPRMIVEQRDCPGIAEALPRTGLELAEAIARNTPIVVGCMVAAVIDRQAVLP